MPNPPPPPRPEPLTRYPQAELEERMRSQEPIAMQRLHTSKNPHQFRPDHERNVVEVITSGREDRFGESIEEVYLCDEDRDVVLEGAVNILLDWGDVRALKTLRVWLGSEKQRRGLKIRSFKDFTEGTKKWLSEYFNLEEVVEGQEGQRGQEAEEVAVAEGWRTWGTEN